VTVNFKVSTGSCGKELCFVGVFTTLRKATSNLLYVTPFAGKILDIWGLFENLSKKLQV